MNDTEPLGERVRRLRVARRLSQTDLAGDGVSGSYVSLIESGRREPSPSAVDVIARRLGTTAAYLLTGVEPRPERQIRLDLSDAEMALLNGDPHLALDRYLALAAEFGPAGDTAEEQDSLKRATWRTAIWGVARASERLNDLRGATLRLERLRAASEPDDVEPTWMRVLTDLARCYRESGDRNLAARIAEEGLAAVARLGGTSTSEERDLANTLIVCYYESGDWLRASTLAEDTLRRAREEADPRARASTYWSASQVAQSAGENGLALEYAERAQALFAESERERDLAMTTVHRAWLLLAQDAGNAREALALLRPVETKLEESGDDLPLAYCRLEVARALLHQTSSEEAETLADLAAESFGDAGNRESQVDALVVQAQARIQAGRRPAAGKRLERATELLERLDGNRSTAALWMSVAQTYQAMGETDAAMRAYGRTAHAAGVRPPPQPVLTAGPDSRPSRKRSHADSQ